MKINFVVTAHIFGHFISSSLSFHFTLAACPPGSVPLLHPQPSPFSNPHLGRNPLRDSGLQTGLCSNTYGIFGLEGGLFHSKLHKERIKRIGSNILCVGFQGVNTPLCAKVGFLFHCPEQRAVVAGRGKELMQQYILIMKET